MRKTQRKHGRLIHRIPVAVWLAVLLATTSARAESVVLAVAGSGDASSREQIGATAGASLASSGWTTADPAPTTRQVAALEACVRKRAADACARILAAHHVERGLVLLVDRGSDPSAPITLTGYLLGADGVVIATEQRFCETTETEELEARARNLVAALVGGQINGGEHTVLVIHSQPPGARVMVDNEAVGVTPMEYGVTPGPHKLSVDKAGYEIEVRQVDAPAGTTQTVELELQAILTPDRPPPPPVRRRASRWPARLTVAAAVLAIGAGVALVLADDPERDSSPRDPDGTLQRYSRDSKLPGLIAIGAGALGVGAGVYLFVRAGRSDREAPPGASSARGQVVGLGLAGRF